MGQYLLEELIGRGGMGEVYRAVDTRRGRTVALKLLNPGFADEPTFRARFLRESRLAARLNDPHVIPIHDWGEIDGLLFIDMRLVMGRDLRHIIAGDGPLGDTRAVAIVGQIADALDAAHADGLVHRDVKPDNILVDNRDFAYLVDFGLAQGLADSRLTGTGAAVGSFGYMAPERFGADPAGAPADIYALSCVLYECLSGEQPFGRATSIEQLVAAHLTADPPRLGSALDPVIAHGMAKNPADRFPTAGALLAAARAACDTASRVVDPALGTSSTASPIAPPTVRQAAEPPVTSSPTAAGTSTPHFRGSSVDRVGAGAPPSAWAQTQTPAPSSGGRGAAGRGTGGRHTTLIVGLAVAAVLLLVGIGVGAWLLSGSRDQGSTVAGPAPIATPPTSMATASATQTQAPQATPTATPPARGAGDLGLATPISRPACDGTGIVVVGNAVTPGAYATEVQDLLTRFSGSSYLRTDQSCPSLRQSLNGNPIYAVYRVAGPSTTDICTLRNQIGGDAYGKFLDTTSDPGTFITC